eukprot:TRINITY_DN64476_c0_g1_i1.p1 TRINITY_DN64476_c0_g1~~TRINITY_DN64476_c0_g1_i1.p1  ORF type:complete len:881 (+),score=227.84 TRINITY_DN64476_c0_g1_i1:93-2735(+)
MGAQKKPDGAAALVVGSQVDCYSNKFSCWIPATVTIVDPENGSVQLDRMPGRELQLHEQRVILRPRTRPGREQREWVLQVLRDGRIELEARRLFERHAAPRDSESKGGAASAIAGGGTADDAAGAGPRIGEDGECQVLRRGALAAVGEDLDQLLGVSGSVCDLSDIFEHLASASGGSFTLEDFVGVFWEALWAAYQDHGQALDHGGVRKRPWGSQRSYELERVLGEGTYGKVWLAVHRETGATRAIKMIAKDGYGIHDIEVERLQRLDHPNIVKLYEYYTDSTSVHLVMDYCSGGELHDALKKRRSPFPEDFCAHVLRQIMLAVAHIHRHGIVHLDLKSANVMLMPNHATIPPAQRLDTAQGAAFSEPMQLDMQRPHVMVIDLGVAQIFQPGSYRGNRPMGTPATMAPEVWRGEVTPKADVFSSGTILFEMLTRALPWRPGCDVNLAKAYWAAKPSAPWEHAQHCSDFALGLCRRMLLIDKYRRPTAAQCLDSHFLRDADGAPGAGAEFEKGSSDDPAGGAGRLPEPLVRHLARTAERSLLYKSVALAVARAWPSNQLPSIKRAFRDLDESGSGRLEVRDVALALERRLGAEARTEAVEAASAMDLNRDGHVDWSEFVAACVDLGSPRLEADLRRVFDEADGDGDALLDADDVAKLLLADDSACAGEAARVTMRDLVGRCEAGARLDWPTFLGHFRPAGLARSTSETTASAATASEADWGQPSSEDLASHGGGLPSGDAIVAHVIGWWDMACDALLPSGPAAKAPDPAAEAAVQELAAMGFQDRERSRQALKRRGRNRVTGSVIDLIINSEATRADGAVPATGKAPALAGAGAYPGGANAAVGACAHESNGELVSPLVARLLPTMPAAAAAGDTNPVAHV